MARLLGNIHFSFFTELLLAPSLRELPRKWPLHTSTALYNRMTSGHTPGSFLENAFWNLNSFILRRRISDILTDFSPRKTCIPLSDSLSLSVSLSLSHSHPLFLSFFLSLSLSISLSIYLSICISIYLYLCNCISISFCLSLSIFLFSLPSLFLFIDFSHSKIRYTPPTLLSTPLPLFHRE